MRIGGIVILAFFIFPSFANANVVINEIAWMGSTSKASAEWIELANTGTTPVDLSGWTVTSSTGSPSIKLLGSISARGYSLLERTSDSTVPNISADQIYKGGLSNTGATLTLSNSSGATIDTVIGGKNWANIGGDNVSKETAQRTSTGWETAPATPKATNAGVSITTVNTTKSSKSNTFSQISVHSRSTSAYVPSPSVLSIKIQGIQNTLMEVPMTLSAQVLNKKGIVDPSARIMWGFGDGSSAIGSLVTKTYHYAGTYLITATAKDGNVSAYGDVIINITKALVNINNVSNKGIVIKNNSDKRLNLSQWWILSGNVRFRIPSGTVLLPRASVLFPFSIMNMPISFRAVLTYPDGLFVASYAPKISAQHIKQKTSQSISVNITVPKHVLQPLAIGKRSNKRQVVGKITNYKKNIYLNAKESYAPTDAKNLASVGAALPSVATALIKEASTTSIRYTSTKNSSGIFHSGWTVGLLGIIILAGSAFILL